MQNLIDLYIAPLTIPSEHIGWENLNVIHQERVKCISVPVLISMKAGRRNGEFDIAENNFTLFRLSAVAEAKKEIDLILEGEALAKAKMQTEFDAKIAAILTTANTKQQKIYRFFAQWGIGIMVLATVFTFLMSLININAFFGDAFAEMVGKNGQWFFVTMISLLLAGATPFFAMLKNKKIVAKTVWLVPIDMLVAFINSNQHIKDDWFLYAGGGFYTVALAIILYFIMKFFIGKGVPDQEAYYETIMASMTSPANK